LIPIPGRVADIRKLIERKSEEIQHGICRTVRQMRSGAGRLGMVLPATATSRTPTWRPSRWECRGRRLSRA
jgi:hypothetical protein